MALSFGNDSLEPYAGLRIAPMAPMGFRQQQHKQRRTKSEDFRGADQYQALIQASESSEQDPVQYRAQHSLQHLVPLSAQKNAQEPLQKPSVKPSQSASAALPQPLRARGLNIQFGLSPVLDQQPCVSPRLEGNEWDVIDERTKLMAQLHTLQAEIVHLARRNNERIGVTTSSVAAETSCPVQRRHSSSRSISSCDAEALASTSFSSSDTLFEEESDWTDLVNTDPFNDDERHLVMNVADLQKLRDLRESAIRHQGQPTISACFHQVLVDLAMLGNALIHCASHHKLVTSATLIALLAIGAYYAIST